jgi:hypothetical protein
MTYLPVPFIRTVDTHTVVGSGSITTLDAPLRSWTIVVVGTTAPATLWDVTLEGSLDGVKFSDMLNHTSLTGDGQHLFSGTTLFPALYIRTTVNTLTLGPATDIVVTVLGQ